MATARSDYQSYLNQLETFLEKYLLQKAPPLPEKWKGIWVKMLPYLVIIMLIFSIPVVLAAFGVSAFVLPFSMIGGLGIGLSFILAVALLAVTIVLEAMALPQLFKPAERGWRLLYYAALLGGLVNLITLNLGGLIIGTTLSLYLLFQTRSYYK